MSAPAENLHPLARFPEEWSEVTSALGEPSYLELWRALPADSKVEEVIRNFFVRQPLLWVSAPE